MRKAKSADKPVKMEDGGGLYILLKRTDPSGGAGTTGGQSRASGRWRTYPGVGLASARERLDVARKLLALGVDPGESRKAEKAAGEERAGNGFEVAAREWLATQKRVPGHIVKVSAWRTTTCFRTLAADPQPSSRRRSARKIEGRGASSLPTVSSRTVVR